MIKREIPVIGISTEIDIPGRISVKENMWMLSFKRAASLLFFRLPTMYRFYNLWFLLLMVYS